MGRALLPSLLLASALAVPLGAVAQSPGDDPVGFRVRVIYATERKGNVDPACADLQPRLPGRFRTLQLVHQEDVRLGFGERYRQRLPNGDLVEILPIGILSQSLHMQFAMTNSVNTRLQVRSGHPLIFGGPRHGEGRLIVEVLPRFDTAPRRGPPLPSSVPTLVPVHATEPATR